MKKILLLALCLFAGSVVAQDLFPELAGLGGRTKNVEKKVEPDTAPAPVVEEEVAVESVETGSEETLTEEDMADSLGVETVQEQETDLFAAPVVEENKVEEEATEEEEEEEEHEEQKITIYMQDAEATMTPNRNFSYCFGILKVLSTMKKPVVALDVVLKYGDLTTNYNVRNLVKDAEQTGTITLMGDSCEHIMDMPEMTIKTCKIPDMDEKACKKKVEFLPLRGE